MKLMIVTNVFKRIDHDILLTLAGEGYKLMIRELGPIVQTVNNDHGPLNCPPLEEMDSNDEVLGFEDLMENLDVENGLAQSNTKLDDRSLRDQGRDWSLWMKRNDVVFKQQELDAYALFGVGIAAACAGICLSSSLVLLVPYHVFFSFSFAVSVP
ncbi:hypothetical protein Cgig2_027175 [Carnegiea gigantea]|uniref:Uncharacterized protein n=1 Tax=Carnegiea gigantea TaxID=171969 RepID=A0A9Q1QNE6_9CARY|nr:hypothetical protein Cgig2_027175 [Carnegiea gigantea]